jgi:hypothetical protein
MSEQPEDTNNLLNFIAATVESMREEMATKDDLAQAATKSDVDSLRSEVAFIGGQVETMRDQMATKEDLASLETRLTDKLEVEITAVRGDIEQIHLRLE